MRDNWKLWLTGTIVLVILGIAIQRMRTSFVEQAPAWMQVQQFSSPKLSAELADQVPAFYRELENESKATGLPIQSMQLVQIMPGNKEIQTWRLDKLTNPGAVPLAKFEITRSLKENQLIGYYMLDGAPVDFMLRHHPTDPKVRFATLKFEKTVNAGTTFTTLYLERQTSTLKTNAAGEFTYQFPKLRNADKEIQAVGVILPQSYTLIRYGPTAGAFSSMKGSPIVAWINTRIDAVSLPPSVTFKPL